jgi:hypothetical protein
LINLGHEVAQYVSYRWILKATDHLLLVEAQMGTILRVAARIEGREFRVAEAAEVSFDEEFGEGTFRLELPGVQFRQLQTARYLKHERAS